MYERKYVKLRKWLKLLRTFIRTGVYSFYVSPLIVITRMNSLAFEFVAFERDVAPVKPVPRLTHT